MTQNPYFPGVDEANADQYLGALVANRSLETRDNLIRMRDRGFSQVSFSARQMPGVFKGEVAHTQNLVFFSPETGGYASLSRADRVSENGKPENNSDEWNTATDAYLTTVPAVIKDSKTPSCVDYDLFNSVVLPQMFAAGKQYALQPLIHSGQMVHPSQIIAQVKRDPLHLAQSGNTSVAASRIPPRSRADSRVDRDH